MTNFLILGLGCLSENLKETEEWETTLGVVCALVALNQYTLQQTEKYRNKRKSEDYIEDNTWVCVDMVFLFLCST